MWREILGNGNLCIRSDPRFRGHLFLRNTDAEMSTGEFIGIDQFRCSVMGLHAFKNNGQAYARSGYMTTLFLLALKERIEYARAFICRYPGSGVRYLENKAQVIKTPAYRDDPVFRRKFDGVRQEIVEHGSYLVTISIQDDVVHLDA
jgi:hypothetical protein